MLRLTHCIHASIAISMILFLTACEKQSSTKQAKETAGKVAFSQADITEDSHEFMTEFKKYSTKSDAKAKTKVASYIGRKIQLNGFVDSVCLEIKEEKHYCVTMSDSVKCYFSEGHGQRLLSLNQGQPISIKGEIIDTTSSSIILDGCLFVNHSNRSR